MKYLARYITHLAITVSISFVLILIPFYETDAALTGLPFGGLATTPLPCTCPTKLSFVWYAFVPLYFTAVPVAGALVAPPFVTYATYTVHPSSWALGTYIPGAAIDCGFFIPPTPVNPPICIPYPNAGLITPFTGTSLTV